MDEKKKYLVTIDQDNINDITVKPDDPAYDGCESNIDDPEGVYHIKAPNEESAIDAARWLDSIGNEKYCDVGDDF